MSTFDENMIRAEIDSKVHGMRNEISRLKVFCLFLMEQSGIDTIPGDALSYINPAAFNWEFNKDQTWHLQNISRDPVERTTE